MFCVFLCLLYFPSLESDLKGAFCLPMRTASHIPLLTGCLCVLPECLTYGLQLGLSTISTAQRLSFRRLHANSLVLLARCAASYRTTVCFSTIVFKRSSTGWSRAGSWTEMVFIEIRAGQAVLYAYKNALLERQVFFSKRKTLCKVIRYRQMK